MPSLDHFIALCSSWNDFWDRARKLSNTEKGIVFERLTQLYLRTAPEYRTELQHVWLLRDVPVDIRRRLNLPGPDEGIDLIARTRRGEYWAIQTKFRSQRDKPLNRRELGTFTSLAFNTCNNIALAIVAHTASKPVSKRHLMRNTVEIGLDRWHSLDQESWRLSFLRASAMAIIAIPLALRRAAASTMHPAYPPPFTAGARQRCREPLEGSRWDRAALERKA